LTEGLNGCTENAGPENGGPIIWMLEGGKYRI